MTGVSSANASEIALAAVVGFNFSVKRASNSGFDVIPDASFSDSESVS